MPCLRTFGLLFTFSVLAVCSDTALLGQSGSMASPSKAKQSGSPTPNGHINEGMGKEAKPAAIASSGAAFAGRVTLPSVIAGQQGFSAPLTGSTAVASPMGSSFFLVPPSCPGLSVQAVFLNAPGTSTAQVSYTSQYPGDPLTNTGFLCTANANKGKPASCSGTISVAAGSLIELDLVVDAGWAGATLFTTAVCQSAAGIAHTEQKPR